MHAAIVGAVLWTVAAVSLAFPGPRDAFDTLKGGDFVHFYTLGDVTVGALRGRGAEALYDADALYARQTALVPASAPDRYVPIYPPQTGLVFAAFSLLPYGLGFVTWSLVVMGIYALCLDRSWRAAGPARPPGWSLAVIAIAFPPFWNLILHGQTSIVPVVAFTGAALYYARGYRVVAGMFLGLLAVKPQFAVAAGLLFLLAGEWRMIAGAVVAGVLQALAAIAVFGPQIWNEFLRTAFAMRGHVELLEPRPYQLHSIAALTRLLPAPAGLLVWVVSVVAVIWMLWKVWRTPAPPLMKFGVLILASVLVNPHLTVYDAVVLLPAALWVGAWVNASGREWLQQKFWSLAYWTFALLLAPTAWLLGVQASVLLMVGIFVTLSGAVLSPRATADPGT